jgi:excisionase family DNA binding protein
MSGELLTFAEVAQRLGEDVNTIRRNVRAEQIPVVRIGRKVRIPAAWVDDPAGWLQ